MPKILLTVLSCVWVFFFALLIVYLFPAPREAVLSILSAREGTDSTSLNTLRAVALAQAASAPSLASMSTNATSSPYQEPVTYEYRLLQNVDPCTFTKMGAQGWSISQFGGNLVPVGGSDASCSNYANYTGFDWVLFSRSHVPAGSCLVGG